MDRLPVRRRLWASAGLDQFAVQCESAPPRSDDRPDETHLGWDGTLEETECFPDKGHEINEGYRWKIFEKTDKSHFTTRK